MNSKHSRFYIVNPVIPSKRILLILSEMAKNGDVWDKYGVFLDNFGVIWAQFGIVWDKVWNTDTPKNRISNVNNAEN